MNKDDFLVLTSYASGKTLFVRKNAISEFDDETQGEGTRYYLFGDPNPRFCRESIEKFWSMLAA